jgi:hypothetical protein
MEPRQFLRGALRFLAFDRTCILYRPFFYVFGCVTVSPRGGPHLVSLQKQRSNRQHLKREVSHRIRATAARTLVALSACEIRGRNSLPVPPAGAQPSGGSGIRDYPGAVRIGRRLHPSDR